MTLDILKSEALKLQRTELFDFVEFILVTLREKEQKGEVETPDWLKAEISKRATEMKTNNENSITGQDVYHEIINKYGFDIPTSLLS
jgi:hypothetical protein